MVKTVQIVSIQDVDVEKVTELWNVSFKGAYLNSFFPIKNLDKQKNVLSGIDNCASFAALKDGELIGAVLSFSDFRHENDSAWHTIFPGWIGAVFVREDNQGCGVATELLKTAEDAHKRKGRMLLFAGGGEGSANFFPGLEENWINGQKLLQKMGYVQVRRTCYIELNLKKWIEPEAISYKREKLISDNINILPMAEKLKDAYMRYAQKAGGDAGFSKLPEDLSGMFVAVDDGEIIGEVHGIQLDDDNNGIFNGIQVLDEYRNRSIGKLLLVEAIYYTRQLGGKIMQLWTRPMTANRFYVPIGFEIVKNYDVYGKILEQNLLSEKWIARFRHL